MPQPLLPDTPGAPPAGGFAPMAPELLVNDLSQSLPFWRDLCGFTIAYARPTEGFAYLTHPDGAQIMLCERSGVWESGPMDLPFGRGVLFQIVVGDITRISSRFHAANRPLYMPGREVWRDFGNCLGGRKEIGVQDPDGYLILFTQQIGFRPL